MSTLNRQDDEGKDRISSLPDSLLITILSLLSIDSAAATSALSRRWRHLWTHLTHISLPPPQKPAFKDLFFYLTTVHRILSQLKSPKIHYFEFEFGFNLPEKINQLCFSLLGQWIHQICQQNPDIIRLVATDHYHGLLYKVPTCILQTQSLVQLEFHHYFKFDDDKSNGLFDINLPNLEKLKLCVYDSYRFLMGNLFKSCPLLKDLELLMLDFEEDHHCVNISAPNLKFLIIAMKVKDGWLSNDIAFVIDAPMLEYCRINGFIMSFDFIEKPNSLRQVILSISKIYADNSGDECLSKIQQLFQGISSVEYLIFENWQATLLCSLSKVALPIFNNLMHLEILFKDKDNDQEWNLYPCLPTNFLGKLEKLTLCNLMGIDIEIEMIQDILSKATVLKQLHVYNLCCESDEEDILRTEYEFCKKLFMLLESSSSCEIKFFGDAIIASKEDFKDGVLTCQIIDHSSRNN